MSEEVWTEPTGWEETTAAAPDVRGSLSTWAVFNLSACGSVLVAFIIEVPIPARILALLGIFFAILFSWNATARKGGEA